MVLEINILDTNAEFDDLLFPSENIFSLFFP